MFELYKKYLLSSVAFAPDEKSGAADGGTPDATDAEADQTDDELVLDPAGEDDGTEGAEDPDDATDPDDGDGAEDAGDGEDDAVVAAADRKPSRSERRIQALADERRRMADDNARLTRELADARRAQQQPAETAAHRAERLALLLPEERAQVMVTEALAEHDRKSNMLTFQLLEQSDKTAFDARIGANPLYKKLAPEVENKLREIRAQGGNSPRDAILTYVLGERARKQLENPQRKSGAQQRQKQQQSRPVNARSDVQPDRRNRGDSVAAMEKRLENQQI